MPVPRTADRLINCLLDSLCSCFIFYLLFVKRLGDDVVCPGVQTFRVFDAGFAIPQVKCLPIREMRERMSSHPDSPASRRFRSIRRRFVSGSGAQGRGAFLPPVEISSPWVRYSSRLFSAFTGLHEAPPSS